MAAPKAKPAAKGTGVAVQRAKINLPVDVEAQRAAEIAAFAKRLQAPTGNNIKTDEKIFTLPNGDTHEELSVVIVDFVSCNDYYSGPWNPNQVVPPECFARGLEPTGLVPSENSPELQAESCAACWANQWKSSATGNGKACSNTVRLAVMAPDEDETAPLLTLKVTATALKSFNAYVSTLARAGVVPRDVVTTITFDPNLKYSSLRFSNPVGASEDQRAVAYSRREEAMQSLMREPDVTPPAEAPAPVSKKPVSKVVAKPAPRPRKAT